MYRIYFDNRHINIVSSLEESLSEHNSIACKVVSDKNLCDIFYHFQISSQITSLFIISQQPERDFNLIISKMNLISAAGGIIENATNQVIMIVRNGYWDLPKGKVESYESIEQAAMREVCEECGINRESIELSNKICNTYHTYKIDERLIVKETQWFIMRISDTGESVSPQREENIEQVVWVDKTALADHIKSLTNIYPSIISVIEEYLTLI